MNLPTNDEVFTGFVQKILKPTGEISKRDRVKCNATKKTLKEFYSFKWNGQSYGAFKNIPVMREYLSSKYNDFHSKYMDETCTVYTVTKPVPTLQNFTICKKATDYEEWLKKEGQAYDFEYWEGLSPREQCTGTTKKRKRPVEKKKPVQKKVKEERQVCKRAVYYLAYPNQKKLKEIPTDKALKRVCNIINSSKREPVIEVQSGKFIAYGTVPNDMKDETTKSEVFEKLNLDQNNFEGAVLLLATKTFKLP